ncbi:YpmS family protein [Oceanobacillus massiliensis]|uniref:YpmS family protein n=1 Tax=Oceanobacillus massiliensis TaxID=1465765 RepID=UPI0002895B85|nr:YpmS family protein [Oceanobacillus massiliensis]
MSDRKQRLSIRNRWKKLFYGLLAINIVIMISLLLLIFWPVSENEFPNTADQTEQEGSEFVIRTTKQNLNDLVNAYIEKSLGNSNHHYRISLEDDVHLIGELPVFSTAVPLSVHLEPLVQENGDLILKQKSISVGLLELPNQKIMEYMDKYLPMPEWVTINPEDQEIYVAVTEMDLQSNLVVAVQTIDLEANNLAFKLRVPYETLGIDMLSD